MSFTSHNIHTGNDLDLGLMINPTNIELFLTCLAILTISTDKTVDSMNSQPSTNARPTKVYTVYAHSWQPEGVHHFLATNVVISTFPAKFLK